MISTELQQAILARIKKIPIFETLQMEVVGLDEGYCEVKVPRQTRYDGVYESFHGGILMTIADSIACFAIFTKTGPEQIMTTTDMNIRFLAPCLSEVRAKAKVIKFGRTLCPVAVDIFDAAGKHLAVAQVNYILLDRMPNR
jgi:uncharacterized protein (TIGR00369 family)